MCYVPYSVRYLSNQCPTSNAHIRSNFTSADLHKYKHTAGVKLLIEGEHKSMAEHASYSGNEPFNNTTTFWNIRLVKKWRVGSNSPY